MSEVLKEKIESAEKKLRLQLAEARKRRFEALQISVSNAAAVSKVNSRKESVDFAYEDRQCQELQDLVEELRSLDFFVYIHQNHCGQWIHIEPMALHKEKLAQEKLAQEKNETSYCLLLYCGGSTSMGVALAGTSHHEAVSRAAAAETRGDSAGGAKTDGC